jgi:hypothetical protein
MRKKKFGTPAMHRLCTMRPQDFNSPYHVPLLLPSMAVRKTVLTLAFSLATAGVASAQGTSPTLYRVFLSDGSALASFGEWARVDDRVVFSMPVAAAGDGDLHLVSLPVHRVDLERTERYADAVRGAQYAATRGDADFAQLSSSIALTLNQIAIITDPAQRLASAEQARRTLAAWPAAHYGYRAAEVREFLTVLDDVISGLRAQAGQRGFDIALTVNTEAPPREPLLPAPDHAEVVQNLMSAARVVDSPAERVSLMQTLVAFIDRAIEYLPASLASAFKATALSDIAEEQRVEAAYGQLRTATLSEATRLAERADVRALEQLRLRLGEQDTKLGQRRPDAIAGLASALEVHLDAARRLRLAYDGWLLSEAEMRRYHVAVTPYVRSFLNHRQSLEDIKLLAGPDPQRLRPLARELERIARFAALIASPPTLVAVDAAFRGAFALAANAVELRHDAVRSADVELARRASSAAAGALMLIDRAREDLRVALEPPLKIPARP